MKKAIVILVMLSIVVSFMGCQRPKPTVILPQATEPVSTSTTAPQATGTPLPAFPTPTATLVATPIPSPTATPQVTVHTVSFGENLDSIGQAYGVSWEALAEANGLTSPYLIYVGQELVIPGAGEVMPQPTPTGQIYVVQYGDNLYRIAIRFDTTPEAIAAANNLPDVHTIYVGQTLVIP